MKVLVTGAAGFIGGQLMHALWKNGHTAIGVDNYSYGSADILHFVGPPGFRVATKERERKHLGRKNSFSQ